MSFNKIIFLIIFSFFQSLSFATEINLSPTEKTEQYNLAVRYYNGDGVDKSYRNAIKWFTFSAEQDLLEANEVLGDLYVEGISTTRNIDKSIYYYKKSSELGSSTSMYNLGVIYLDGKYGIERNYIEAIKWLTASAQKGNPDALNAIGLMYLNGIGVPNDTSKAKNFFEEAAKNGSSSGKNNLAFILYSKSGETEENKLKALKLLTDASEEGNIFSINNLGLINYYGVGVDKNYAEAIKWFTKGVEVNNKDSQYYLGVMLYNGDGIEKDINKAKTYFTMASKQKHPKAKQVLLNNYKQ